MRRNRSWTAERFRPKIIDNLSQSRRWDALYTYLEFYLVSENGNRFGPLPYYLQVELLSCYIVEYYSTLHLTV